MDIPKNTRGLGIPAQRINVWKRGHDLEVVLCGNHQKCEGLQAQDGRL